MFTSINLKTHLMHDGGGQIFIEAKLLDKKISMLIDTGASHTIFDKKRLKRKFPQLQFTSERRYSSGFQAQLEPSPEVYIEGLVLGKLNVTPFKAGTIDLSYVNKTYKEIGLKPIDGILGFEILARYRAMIDLTTYMLHMDLTE